MSFFDRVKKITVFLFNLFYKLKYVGFENVGAGNYLICCNHLKFFDPFLVTIPFPKPMHYMAKSELFKIPLVNTFIKKLGAFPIKRGKAHSAAIESAISLLESGENVLIFPEGTRSKTGMPGSPKPGAALVAFRSNAKILPVAIKIQKPKFFSKPHITVSFGHPIENSELPIEKASSNSLKEASKYIMDRICELFYKIEF